MDLTFRNLNDEPMLGCFFLVFLKNEIIISTSGCLSNCKVKEEKLEMKSFNLGNGY